MENEFDLKSFYLNLKTRRLGRQCVYLEKVESTIDVANKAEPGTLVVAREQTRGRGQRNNVWTSPHGCAMGSLKITCTKLSPLSRRLGFLQHVLVIVAARTLEKLDRDKLGKDNIKLKWPNDIIYKPTHEHTGLKIGGVLVHAIENSEHYDITLSFGLNIFNSRPTTCVRDIIGPSKDLSIHKFIAEMLNDLEYLTHDFDDSKFMILKKDYNQRCIQIDKVIEDESNGLVKIKEVDDDGYLLGERCKDGIPCRVTNILRHSI